LISEQKANKGIDFWLYIQSKRGNRKSACKGGMSPQDVVRQDWFQNVLRKDNYDAILVMAHMGTKDPSIQVLLSAI
jgi:hypothetical protein